MNQQSVSGGLKWALAGVLFVAFFMAADFLRPMLATTALPMPTAGAGEVARYFTENQAAALAVSTVQILSALSLFVFAWIVIGVVGGAAGALPMLTRVGGILAPAFLLVSALLGLTLVLVAPGGDLGLIGTLRSLNFLTGGTLHVASLGVFIGAASLAARGTNALPKWIVWLGIVQGIIAVLSLLSLAVYEANALILFGRLLGFLWSISAGIALAIGKRRENVVGGDRRVLA